MNRLLCRKTGTASIFSLPAALAILLAVPVPASAQPAAPNVPADAAAAPAPSEGQVVPPELQTFREAVLPPDLGVPVGNYVVTLVLTVDEAGAVTEVQPSASDEPRLTPLAVEAAKGFVFTPAKVDGQPVAVQITYRYAFDVRPKERRVVQVFNVLEKGTRTVLDGVTAIVEENGRSFTAFTGRMEVSDLAPGKYTLYVPAGEFAEVRRPFTVKEGVVETEDLRLDRRYGSANQTIIRAPKEARFVARQTLEATELKRLPGSGGDPVKMIENLPGVARSSYGTGYLVVYGSSPYDTQVLIDGMPYINLYHFGGLYSTVNPEFIDKIDFVPAGFDATYGQASAGIVDVKTKSEPKTALHGQIDINLLHAGLYFGLPTNDDGDFQFAFRRSYIDAILGAISFGDNIGTTTAPRYYDYQGRLRQKFGKHELTLFVLGTDDEMVFVNKKSTGQEPTFVGNVSLSNSTHAGQLRWTYDHSPDLKNSLSLQTALTTFNFDLFNAVKFKITSSQTNLREEVDWKAHPKAWIHAGLTGLVQPSWYDVKTPAPQREGSVGTPLGAQEKILLKGTQYLYNLGPYISAEIKPYPWWTIVPSVRADFYFGDWTAWSIDPRLSTRFDFLGGRLALKAAGGLYQQPPPVFTYVKDLGNPGLKPQAAVHSLLGIEGSPIDRLTIEASGFFKYMFNQAETSDDKTVRYTNKGEGRAYGFNLLVRLNPGGRLIGWLTYTFTRSEVYDFRTHAWRLSSYDQAHLLNILASYELPRHWTIGARFRLTSGFPYTPVTGSVYDADLDRFVGVPSTKVNSKRLPLFHQLDLRVDKEWVFDDWKFGLYLEIQNLYNQKNAEGLVYNYDLTKTEYLSGTTFLPVLGLKGTW